MPALQLVLESLVEEFHAGGTSGFCFWHWMVDAIPCCHTCWSLQSCFDVRCLTLLFGVILAGVNSWTVLG